VMLLDILTSTSIFIKIGLYGTDRPYSHVLQNAA
jgi:hypothetical protein